MHGWLLTIALAVGFTPEGSSDSVVNTQSPPTADTSTPVQAPPTAADDKHDEQAAAENAPSNTEDPASFEGPNAPDSSATAANTEQKPPQSEPTPGPAAESSAPAKLDPEAQRVALEYRANRAFEVGDYWKAATIWARLANREDGPSKARDHYILRAVAAADLMYDEYGERRALCFAHRVTSTHLRAGRSEGQDYFVKRRREFKNLLEEQIGERWPYACRQLLRESSFGETPMRGQVVFFGGPQAAGPNEPTQSVPEDNCPPDRPPQDGGCGSFDTPVDTPEQVGGRPLFIAGTAVTSLGAATLLGTVTSGIFYRQEIIELTAFAEESQTRPLTSDELAMASASRNRADRYKRAIIGTAIAGGLQVSAGVAMLIVAAKRKRKAKQLSLTPSFGPQGASLQLFGRF